MTRFAYLMLPVLVALACSCSKREPSDPNAEEWADIEARAAGEVVADAESTNQHPVVENLREVPVGEFDAFVRRLDQMRSIKRGKGEALLTGESLVFDHDERFVRLETDVVVEDDQGILSADRLIGRFSISNEVEFIEADGTVDLVSSNRTASAERAVYTVRKGFVRLTGKARASDGMNTLSGEKIEVWMKDDRKMVCEPNALLEIRGGTHLPLSDEPQEAELDTEIRADRVEYDGSKKTAVLSGNVRIRDPRASMNCDDVRIFLKDNNEIDWIEASGGVIIQTRDRKAVAEQATYHAGEGKFMLLGEPKVSQGLNIMTGERIIFWHETQRMVCEPNARVLLYLDEETKAKFLQDLNE